jgi:hypothetical protein
MTYGWDEMWPACSDVHADPLWSSTGAEGGNSPSPRDK